jgi:hypothetical protein
MQGAPGGDLQRGGSSTGAREPNRPIHTGRGRNGTTTRQRASGKVPDWRPPDSGVYSALGNQREKLRLHSAEWIAHDAISGRDPV